MGCVQRVQYQEVVGERLSGEVEVDERSPGLEFEFRRSVGAAADDEELEGRHERDFLAVDLDELAAVWNRKWKRWN